MIRLHPSSPSFALRVPGLRGTPPRLSCRNLRRSKTWVWRRCDSPDWNVATINLGFFPSRRGHHAYRHLTHNSLNRPRGFLPRSSSWPLRSPTGPLPALDYAFKSGLLRVQISILPRILSQPSVIFYLSKYIYSLATAYIYVYDALSFLYRYLCGSYAYI